MTPQPDQQAWAPFRKFLKRPWWLGTTGLITLVGVIFAIIPLVRDDQPKKDTPTTSYQNSGNCNGQGSDINVNCQIMPPPRSIGQVSLTEAFNPSGYFLFDGPPNQLPQPPDYPLDRTMAHCNEWDNWLKAQPKIYPVDPDPYIGLTTGSDDIVAIKKVEVHVFRRVPVTTVTLIECNYGGGFTPGFLIVVDTVQQRTQFRSDDEPDGTFHNMPPGSISLHGLDHDSATIVIASQEKYLYEGALTVTAEVDGKDRELSIGTPNAPLKWAFGGVVGPPGSAKFVESLEMEHGYDWNPLQKQWVHVTTLPPNWMPS